MARKILLVVASLTLVIAGAALYLASPLAGWVTGTAIHVDGGSLAAAGWVRDVNGVWTNMPLVTVNGLNLVPHAMGG